MLRGSKSSQKATKKSTQQKKTTKKAPIKKTTKPTAPQSQSKRTISTLPALNITRPVLNRNKKLNRFNTTSSAFMSTDTAAATTTTTAAPPAGKKVSHEIGFDIVLSKLKKVLETDGISPDELLREQHKAVAGFETRHWDVRDTLTIMPHFLELIGPDGPFSSLAVHRVANLRIQLKTKEEDRKKQAKEAAIDTEALAEDEVNRTLWLNENTVDMVPITDLIRLHMQVLLSSLQYVHLSYQNYCQNTFGFGVGQAGDQNSNAAAEILSVILHHLETVPQLTFYRMHYQQSLLQLTSLLCSNRPNAQLLDILTSMDETTMQSIFMKRFAWSRSEAFKQSLKTAFKKHDVLSDTTMLPLNDPVNVTKTQILSELNHQSNLAITQQSGVTGDALGHLLLEIELSMGVRFPKEPKDILHTKTLYQMTKIAKMPQNPQILARYSKIINNLQLPNERYKAIMDSVYNGQVDQDGKNGDKSLDTQADQLIYQEKVDSTNFIASVNELPVHFPEDLWYVPVSRDERSKYFRQHPQAQALWGIYNKMINLAAELDNDINLSEQLNEQVLALEKSFRDDMTDEEKDDISNKITVRRHRVQLLEEGIPAKGHLMEALNAEYEEKAAPWRQELERMDREAEEAQKAEEQKMKDGVDVADKSPLHQL